MKTRSLLAPLSILPFAALLLSGCTADAQGTASAPPADINIVASTNVYADIARAVAGQDAQVSEVITSSAQDPHSYEPTARDKLTVSKASIVLANGGGYDQFMDSLYGSLPKEQAQEIAMVHAVDYSPVTHEGKPVDNADGHADHDEHDAADGHGHEHADYNEHIWYDLDSMSALADALAQQLGTKDAANAEEYKQNAAAFNDGITTLQAQLAEAGLEKRSYLMTEPVPFHLLEDAGMVNKTPAGLSEAIEEGEGIAPLTMKQSDEMLASKGVDMMVYNTQTEGAETKALRAKAQEAGVPVVELTETITDGSGYLQWMQENISALASAVNR